MTPTLALPRGVRHPLWYTPILLPVLPYVGALLRHQAPAANVPTAVLPLLIVGVALALIVPAWLDHLGSSVRKEAECLRGAWLVSLFLAQVPLTMADDEFLSLGVMMFAATCALMAAIPIGSEFQQRTLAGLLSHPVPRREWWTAKMGVLGTALFLNWTVYLLSRWAMLREVSMTLAGGTLMVAVLAWGTTPWWTLVTRNLLAGLVFSLAVPILLLGSAMAVVDTLTRADLFRLDRDLDRLLTHLLLFGVTPCLALAGAWLGQRRWERLEAPDPASSDSGFPGWPRLGRRTRGLSGRTPAWLHLIGKEFRLQSLTWLLAGGAMVLALLSRLGTPMNTPGELARVGFVLLAGVAILLAGATAIAEERRLGTLDGQLLLPVSRNTQWFLKAGLSGAIAAAIGWVLVRMFASTVEVSATDTSLVTYQVRITVATVFAAALLASSGANHALRAAIHAVVVLGIIVSITITTASLTAEWCGRVSGEVYRSAQEQPEIWKAEALSGSEEDLPRTNQIEPTRIDTLGPGWTIASLAPVVLALFFAWRNFVRTPPSRGRLLVQFATCLGLLLVGAAAWSWWLVETTRTGARRDWLQTAYAMARAEQRFTPAERELWTRYGTAPLAPMIQVEVTLPATDEMEARVEKRGFLLPLAGDLPRRWLIHQARIPAPLREALRQEGLSKGLDVTPPPPEKRRPPHPDLRVAPGALRARYGLPPQP